MTKLALIRTVVVAIFVGAAALVTAYLYQEGDDAGAPATSEKVASAPAQDNAVSESGKAPSEPVAQTDEAPSDGTAPAAETAETADGDEPSFDVVGIEPTGDAVVAGRAEAGSIVALVANGEVVGKTVADANGEWTIILDRPLPAGDYDVALQIQEEDGTARQESSQRLTVSVPEDGKKQPLVVLNSPDAPSTLLQKPDLSASSEQTVARTDGEADGQASETTPAETNLAAAQQQSSPTTEGSGTEVSSAAPASATGQGQSAETDTDQGTPAVSGAGTVDVANIGAGSETSDNAGTADATADDQGQSEATAVVAAVEPDNTASDGGAATEGSETQTAGAVGEEAPSSEAAPTATETAAVDTQEGVSVEGGVTVTVDAVEAERGTVYVAGTAETGRVVQVYVGDQLLGSVEAGSNGRWLVQGPMALDAGAVEVRADMVGADGKVISRAAVTFEKEAEAIVLTKVEATGSAATEGASSQASVEKPLPNVIIRKGDNLWRISRRLYGSGFRYTTIYQANRGQIRNPDLIYPGQVFLTPEGDVNWSGEEGAVQSN